MNHGRILRALIALGAFISLSAQATSLGAKPGEYVVRLKPVQMQMQALQRVLGAEVKRVLSHDLNIVLVGKSTVETPESVINTLAHNPYVMYAEPNYKYRVSGGSSVTPNDPELGRLWGLINTGQKAVGGDGPIDGTPGIDIDAARAWKVETGSKDVVVAVIDTGVNYNERDLKDNIFINQAEANGKPAVDDDANGFIDDIHGWDFSNKADGTPKNNNDPMDVYGHGTHVSSTIGASANDGYGITGVAWNVRILPVRFLGDDGGGELAGAISAIDYATKMKANIMSNSWGGGNFSQILMDAIANAQKAGILFVVAAGNDSNDNDATPVYPASYQLDNILSVAAIDPNGFVASFSNYGKSSVHIAAPGVGIVSHTMKGLESWDGTSMATPHVSGVAALLLSQDMNQSYATIKSRILNAARPFAALRGRVSSGGMLNAYYALTNQMAPADANDPFNWQKMAKASSTDHPYLPNTKKTFTFQVPGAKRIAVSFAKFETESTYDTVTFTDSAGNVSKGVFSGKLGQVFGPAVDGDTVTVSFSADSSVNAYGFDIDGVSYQ